MEERLLGGSVSHSLLARGSGKGGDREASLTVGYDQPDCVVLGLGYGDKTTRRDGHAVRRGELGLLGRSVAVSFLVRTTGQGRYLAPSGHDPDCVIENIRNQDGIFTPGRQADRLVEAGRWAIGKSCRAVPGENLKGV
jgi:hypothetical protein